MRRTNSKRAAPDETASAEILPMRAFGLNDRLGFHMRMAQTIMHRDFLNSLKELDLSQKLCAFLTLISDNPGISQVDIANTLMTDRATTMAIVDRLQDRGLLYRARSREDGRRQALFLTDVGVETLRQADALIVEHEDRFSAKFSKAELAMLTELLMRVYQT